MNIKGETLAKPKETLGEHTENTLRVGNYILDFHKETIHKISEKLPNEFFISNRSRREVRDFILELIKFHDYGKLNPYFQSHIKGEEHYEKIQRKHSIYSFYLWLSSNIKQSLNENTLLIRTIIAYACIAGHHGSLKELNEEILQSNFRVLFKEIDFLKSWDCLSDDEIEDIKDTIEDFSYEEVIIDSSISLFLSKFAFSTLITSDSISSSEINPMEYEKAVSHLFEKDIKNTSFENKISSYPYIKKTRESPFKKDVSFKDMDNIFDIRSLLNQRSYEAYDKNVDIYILEAAVGTGKTVSSLSLTERLIKEDEKRKLISVFPLNSVQTQYVKTLTDDFEIDKETLSVINSESLFGLKKDNETDLKVTPNNLWLFERNCFSNELVITSHVRFFDTFSSISRKNALGFLNLRDSVVIIDEFQNYPPKYWFNVWNELLLMSEMFGVKWVFTTGTFPVSEKQLTEQFGNKIKKVLTRTENNELFGSPYVKDRCAISELNKDVKEYEDMGSIASDILINLREQELRGHTQFIACMSFVKPSKSLYSLLSKELEEYTCYYLCGRHSSEYKKELIKKIHKHHENPSDKVLLVTTKTVECGMDFDFDCGYKEFDMFDSVEQLSGRINRSNKKTGCELKTFQYSRKKLENEKFYHYQDETLIKLNNKEFISLYEEMYKDNKISLSKYRNKLNEINEKCEYEKYRQLMKVIDDINYCEDILLINEDNETEFIDIIENSPIGETYPDYIVNSMKLNKKIEKYKITVTTRWLKEKLNNVLMEREINGFNYYFIHKENFEFEMDKYVLGDVTSFLEKDSVQEINYEFY